MCFVSAESSESGTVTVWAAVWWNISTRVEHLCPEPTHTAIQALGASRGNIDPSTFACLMQV